MKKEKEDIWHVPVTWCIIIVLVLIGGGSFAHQYCTNDDIVKLISFAATLASIILSILAIFMTILSNDSISSIVHKIMTMYESVQSLPSEMKKSSEEMSNIIRTIEGATSEVKNASTELKNTSSQTNEIIGNKITEIQRQMHEMESHISQDITERMKLTETRSMPSPDSFKDDTEDSSHENLFIHNSLTNLVLLYALLLYKERRLTHPLNITELCKEQQLGDDAYSHGALTAMAAMDLFQAKIYRNTDIYISNIESIHSCINEDNLKEGIKSWCKSYNQEDSERPKFEAEDVIAKIQGSSLLTNNKDT